MKGVIRLGKKGKLSLKFIVPFEIIQQIGLVDYDLALPLGLLVIDPVFHVLMFKRYHLKDSHVI